MANFPAMKTLGFLLPPLRVNIERNKKFLITRVEWARARLEYIRHFKKEIYLFLLLLKGESVGFLTRAMDECFSAYAFS